MGRADYLSLGDFNAICEVCGRKYKGSQLKKRWDGLMVCPSDWEVRHPQDFVRGVRDNPSTPFSRPDPPDQFTPVICTTRTAICGYAVSGCAIAGNITFPSTSIVN